MTTRRYWLLLALLLAAGPLAAETRTDYAAILMGGQKIGHVKSTRTVADGKVTTRTEMHLSIGRGEVGLKVSQIEQSVETADGKPLAFSASQDLALMAKTVEATVADGQVTATVTSAAGVENKQFAWPEGALLTEGSRLLSLKQGLKEGTRYSVPVFSPSMLQSLPTEVVVGPTKDVDLLGRVVRLTEVAATTQAPTGQIVTTTYVDAQGEARKTVTQMLGMELEIVECTEQVALSPNQPPDFLTKLLVAGPQGLADAAAAKAITYVLVPAEGKRLDIPATDEQQVKAADGGKIALTVRPLAMPAGSARPYKGDDEAALAALKPGSFVQSGDPKIVELARQAVGDAADVAEAARRIEAFVRGYIQKKSLSVGYATASEVAVTRQGDCTEHAVLATALCRAAGVPAQVVTGLAYTQQFAGRKDVFVPHAWFRVFVGGKWVGLDAALEGFDARHIALCCGDGDPAGFFNLATTLGYFQIAEAKVEK